MVVVSGRMQREEWQKLRRLRSSRGRVQVEPFLRYRSLFFLLVRRAWASTRQKQLQWRNRRSYQRCRRCSASNQRGRGRDAHHHHAHGCVDGELQPLGGGVAALVELEVRLLGADHLAGGGGAVGLRCREARGESEGEFMGGGVIGGAGELLDDGAEVGRVGLDEGGVGSGG